MTAIVMLVTAMFAVAGIGAIRTISQVSIAKDHCFQLAAGASRSGAQMLGVEDASGASQVMSDQDAYAGAMRWLAVNATTGAVTTSPDTVSVSVSERISTPFGSYTLHASASAHSNPVAS
ncbi:MAG: hypothetical protein ACRDY2_08225 [Acidimicrobiales bacterium]